MADKSVQVAVRIRPLVNSEISKGCKDVLEVFSGLNQVRIRNTDKSFTYNYVFDPNSTQDAVYQGCVKKVIQQLFSGYNVTILAYGQTGSGKTHTMGTAYSGEEESGVIPRAVAEIFNYVADHCSVDFTLTVSFMELYQETLYDLLADKPREQCSLEIREDSCKGVFIPGLTEVPVTDKGSVLEVLMRGSAGRVTGATNMNAQSSRSHAIFTINVSILNKIDGTEKTAKLHLVDLAGSERPKKTGAVGTTFKEGVNINKGLLVLGNVISALGDDKLQHGYIPYRDSNLTRLLKDSLGGNSVTLMIACVSPADYNVEETVSTLRYADRAKKIQNKPVINEDPKAAEINLLRRKIQELKLQIVGQGGPALGSEEAVHLKQENLNLQGRIRDMTIHLSSTLNSNTDLLEKLMILQNANEILHKKIEDLKTDYNVVLENISSGVNNKNLNVIKEGLTQLKRIQEQFVVIDSEQRKVENEIFQHEQTVDLHNSQNNSFTDESEMSKNHENYTNKQMALNVELQEITKKLAMKEHLARQITTNTNYMVDYQGLAENEEKIVSLEKERNELLQQLKSAQHQGPSAKMLEHRRKRVQELEMQIQELNKKVQEQARLIKLKEKDETKISRLDKEILQMKQTRVKLIKKMREESERFKAWKIQRERELAKLKQQDRKKQNQIVKMEAMHCKQQNVLKRKVEEAVAINKRLKEALAVRKAAQDTKNMGKIEKMGHWVKQEFDIYIHLVEAEATLKGLLEDRATLQQQLDKLQQNPEDLDESQIQTVQEDIELRSVQIQDLQQKLLDSEDETKKSKFESIQTISEAKFTLKMLLEQVAVIKRSEVATRTKLIDTQDCQHESKNRIASLEKMIKLMEYKNADDVSNLEKEYEEKIAVLLRQLRGVEIKDGNEELKQRCAIQGKKLEELDKTNQELLATLHDHQNEISELREKLETITQMAKESDPDEFKTPTIVKNKKLTIMKEIDSTFVLENQENIDSSFEDQTDNLDKDPDWKRTPIGKWLLDKKRRATQRNLSITDDVDKVPLKRTSDGGCMCMKSNCSRRCGCRKLNQKCSLGCKCVTSFCTNRGDEQNLTVMDVHMEEKRPKLSKITPVLLIADSD